MHKHIYPIRGFVDMGTFDANENENENEQKRDRMSMTVTMVAVATGHSRYDGNHSMRVGRCCSVPININRQCETRANNDKIKLCVPLCLSSDVGGGG